MVNPYVVSALQLGIWKQKHQKKEDFTQVIFCRGPKDCIIPYNHTIPLDDCNLHCPNEKCEQYYNLKKVLEGK